MVVVLTALLVCLTSIELAWLLRPRPQPVVAHEPERVASVLDERLLEYVVVTLKSGTTFGGVLYVEDAGAVVLAKAEHIKRDGTKVPADGEIVVLRGDVDFIQRP
jgi:small nuclear ribonucleoprotein (snRNP)-like protein